MAHPIVHVEIPADDPRALGDFYKNVFDFQLNLESTFDYLLFAAAGGPPGAFVGLSDAHRVGSPVLYLGTDDIEGDLAKVAAAGGEVLIPKQEIPGTGWIAMFRDPANNHVGLFSPNAAQS